VHTDNPLEALRGIMKQTGMLNDRFETCLRDDALMKKISAVRDRGKAAGVDSTPTFFINGERHAGFRTVEEFSALIDPLLPL
jgi:protein-disulfide isomerase